MSKIVNQLNTDCEYEVLSVGYESGELVLVDPDTEAQFSVPCPSSTAKLRESLSRIGYRLIQDSGE